jgi:hypothetical protein
VANQPSGNAGGVTVSKFSINTTGMEQRPWHKGAGVAVAPPAESSTRPETSSSPETDLARVIACEEPISPNAAVPTPSNIQTAFGNRLNMNERFGACIVAAGT